MFHERWPYDRYRLVMVVVEEDEDYTYYGLYILEAGDFVKVGITGNPTERWRDIQRGLPMKIGQTDFTEMDPDRARILENSAHTVLKSRFSHRGEWFRTSFWCAYHVCEELLQCTQWDLAKGGKVYVQPEIIDSIWANWDLKCRLDDIVRSRAYPRGIP